MEKNSFDSRIEAYLNETSAILPNSPKVGDVVEARVAKILPYGAILQLTDNPKLQGLAHISEISHTRVNFVEDYLAVDDIVQAKVINWCREKNYSFSLKNFHLPEKITPASFQNEGEVEVEAEEKKHEEMDLEGKEKEKEEFGEIITHLNGLVGALSPAAKKLLKQIIEEKGVFKFAIAMTEASKSFPNDLSLLFMEEIQRRMDDYL